MKRKAEHKEGELIVYDNTLLKILSVDCYGIVPVYDVKFIAGNPNNEMIAKIPIDYDDVIETYTSQTYDAMKFKPFEKVLVRQFANSYWTCSFFSHYNGFYITMSGKYLQCIPYGPNKKLIGTTEEAHKFYLKQ